MEMMIHHQNFMLAVRQQMGWPAFCPANDCISFASGQKITVEAGIELARIAQTMRKDIVFTSWGSAQAKDPDTFAVAYRELLTVDIIDRLVPFAASEEAPIVLVRTQAEEIFTVDARGTLVRTQGKPKAIGKGRKLAMKRIKAAAAMLGDELLENNRIVTPGTGWSEPSQPIETVIRFR